VTQPLIREHVHVELLRYWCAITLRRNRRELVGIVALLGLLGGLSLFALAGARRTQSSYPRFLRASHASTMAIDPGQYDPAVDSAIASRPEVLQSTTYVAFNTAPMAGDGPDFAQNFETLGTFDGRFFTMDRFAPTQGRLPNVDRDDEIAVNQAAADLYGYRVGQHLDLGTYSDEQINDDSMFDDPPPPMIRKDSIIVGIGLFVDEVVQDDTNRSPLVLVTPAFTKEAAAWAGYAWQGLTLRRGDADVAAVKAWYVAQLDPGSPQFFRVTSVDTFHAQQAVRPLSLALAFFGGIAFVATLVLVSQAVNRRLRRGRADQTVMFSMGASTRALALASFIGPVLAVGVGALLAVGLAYAFSPLMPIGVVRHVEVARGLDADWTVLALGAGIFVFVLALVAAATSLIGLPRRRRAQRVSRGRSRIVGAATRAGLSPPAVTGLRRAFEPGDGAAAVPVRSVIVAGIIAIATIVAALTFGTSFRELLHTPSLYGWSWDSTIFDSSGYGNLNPEGTHQVLDGQPEIAGWSGAYFGADSIAGTNVPLMGMELGSTVVPPLLHGRMIAADDEVVLGPATASALGKTVGDTVAIGVGTNLKSLRVVGIATFPTIGIAHGAHTSLGVGALVVPDLVPGFDRQASGNGPPGTAAGPVGPPVIFVRFAAGANREKAAALVEQVAATTSEFDGSAQVLTAQRPAEIVNSSDVGGVPALLAMMLGAATAISLAITLAASVRRRRGEFALLQSLGFTRRQLTSSVMWQATATIAVGLLIGIPLGIGLGRLLWISFAEQLDVVPHTSVPVILLVAVAVIAIIVANVAAAVPARIARKPQPATVFHSE
jgi:FtsX-like permease family